VQGYVDNLWIRGVHVGPGGTATVELGTNVYRAGEIVNSVLDVSIREIAEGLVTFTDGHGGIYEKRF
jgi:hypothetical protein